MVVRAIQRINERVGLEQMKNNYFVENEYILNLLFLNLICYDRIFY
jgi:hypothetical protein